MIKKIGAIKEYLRINRLAKQLKHEYFLHEESCKHYMVDYKFKLDNDYWKSAARFWDIHSSKVNLESTVCMKNREWTMYNHNTSIIAPFGEFFRLDQVCEILERNPQWRLPLESEYLEFMNKKDYHIENVCDTTIRVNTLLFPSIHPMYHPTYWTISDKLRPYSEKITIRAQSFSVCEFCRDGHINTFFLGNLANDFLWSDKRCVRALVRLVKR